MKITYVNHSCFSVEMEEVVLIFDYFKGTIPPFDSNKKIVLFSSHAHYDHFSTKIFDLAELYNHITFVLSSDIRSNNDLREYLSLNSHMEDKIVFMKEHEEQTFPNVNMKVKTLASTDEGVAFIIEYGDKVIYHAGDLNWWSWEGETQAEYIDMTSRFKKEIAKIKDNHFNVAFVPLDPRQEGRFWWGFDHFMRETKTDVAFPMHLWDKYETIKNLKELERSKDYRDRVMDIHHVEEEFII